MADDKQDKRSSNKKKAPARKTAAKAPSARKPKSPAKAPAKRKKAAPAKKQAAKRPLEKAPKPLDAKEQLFKERYLVHRNTRLAALEAGYSKSLAATKAYLWVSNRKYKPHLYDAIQQGIQEISERNEITADMVLRRWWETANADPNELIQYRRVNCRYCHGIDHQYQWIDHAEFEAETEALQAKAERSGESVNLPEFTGGDGFNGNRDPHPNCPRCDGLGEGEVFVNDTRELSANGRALYSGIRVTRNGIEVQMRDQDKALENVARYLGMFKLDINHGVQEDDPLEALINQISGGAGNVLRPGSKQQASKKAGDKKPRKP